MRSSLENGGKRAEAVAQGDVRRADRRAGLDLIDHVRRAAPGAGVVRLGALHRLLALADRAEAEALLVADALAIAHTMGQVRLAGPAAHQVVPLHGDGLVALVDGGEAEQLTGRRD